MNDRGHEVESVDFISSLIQFEFNPAVLRERRVRFNCIHVSRLRARARVCLCVRIIKDAAEGIEGCLYGKYKVFDCLIDSIFIQYYLPRRNKDKSPEVDRSPLAI